jgi:hypothetical protein
MSSRHLDWFFSSTTRVLLGYIVWTGFFFEYFKGLSFYSLLYFRNGYQAESLLPACFHILGNHFGS